ncbi:hypothetical protein STCU_04351 [Strigomonas culicis]|uniref:Obg-like GTPase YGR210-like G4 motif-containing domain-containing protein n=1 Tax=Strigomonas culicis TaxID=28005 RepID=S9W1M3_9TRYP|nr:hypothetical protein STCU_04351 [Strigomonas culicis]|eukprot:EPY29670.1 hypothetical protein STCU_04351 [Strigomonas culicis]
MFSGYRSTPAFVDGVLLLMGVANETALVQQLRAWGPPELHLLVALYVRRRFPMVIALNKADLPSAAGVHDALRARYPAEHFVPMSAEVECALLALRRQGRLQYVSGEGHFTLPPPPPSGAAAPTAAQQQQLQRVAAFFAPPAAAGGRTTGVQRVLAEALARCAVVCAFPTPTLPPQVPSLRHCLTLRPGATAEDVYWTLCYQKLIDGKFVRCEVVEPRPRGGAAAAQTLRKTDPLPGRAVLVRVLTNKRQMT